MALFKKQIRIKKENKGVFTRKAQRASEDVDDFADTVLGASKGRFSPATRKQANFAKNARKWSRPKRGA